MGQKFVAIEHAINALEFERRERRREMFDLCKYDLTSDLQAEIDRLAVEIRLLEKMVSKLRRLNQDMKANGQASMV